MAESNEVKQQPKTLIYDQDKLQYAINLLNNLQVSGFNNINALKMVFDILSNPIKNDINNEVKK